MALIPRISVALGLLAVINSTASGQADIDEALSTQEIQLVRRVEAQRIKVVNQVIGSVIAVYGKNRQGGGSGVIVHPNGIALTNHHVIEGAGLKGLGGLNDGKLYEWELVGTDPGGDVAIIKMKGKENFPYAPLGDSDQVKVGDWALAMGNPFLLAHDQVPTVTLGIISGVERFQEGAGQNKLVYGNCLQLDSSINPGNSGGPLFNMNGEVIGINGRGSFRDRGRVNVGLGYAISSNQIKNFLPDLLATKIVEHGTLDASFTDRDGKVVCSTLNLDAPVAVAGLELGDRLVEFEGHAIEYANQFKNLICTFPEDWPAQLVVEKKDGSRLSITVRMFGLPYNFAASIDPRQIPPETPEKPADDPPADPRSEDSAEKQDSKNKPRPGQPGGKQPSDKDPTQEPPSDADEKKPAQPPGRNPRPTRGNPELMRYLLSETGAVLDRAANRANLNQIFDQWRQFALPGGQIASPRLIKIEDEITQKDQVIGKQTLWLSTDGRFRIEHVRNGTPQVIVWNGENFLRQTGDQVHSMRLIEAKINPVVAQAIALIGPLLNSPLPQFGEPLLDGGDKAQQQVAYRVMFLDEREDWFYCWFSVFDESGAPEVKLLKCSSDRDSRANRPAISFSQWREVEGIRLPFQKQLVEGLDEKVVWIANTVSCELSDEINDQFLELAKVESGDSK